MISFRNFIEEAAKSSKEEAGYQDKPKGDERCVNCTMWRDPNKCTAVAGDISPDGWCEWYEDRRSKKINKEDYQLDETLKKVNGKWAIVSKKDPSRVLQYYKGDDKPSDKWIAKVERRIQYFKHRG